MSNFVGCENLLLTKNLNVDPRHVGLESSLVPFPQNTSSQRLNMFSSNIVQALIVNGCEQPLISTGFEPQFAEYTYNQTRRNQAIQVIAVIPKYQINMGSYQIRDCNSATIVFQGMEDGLIDYFNLDSYTKGVDGFGYMNTLQNTNRLSPGSIPIPKDMPLCTSPAVDGNRYMLGLNAKVAYMSRSEVAEDPFIISESLASRLETVAIHTVKIPIMLNQIPLNLYGNDDEYKMFPDIGEVVREDGILCGLRTISSNSIITDTRPSALNTPQQFDELIYAAKPGAQILDVDVYINENRKIKTPASILVQPRAYWLNVLSYYERLYRTYQDCKAKEHKFSSGFTSLMSKVIQMLIGYGKSIPGIPKMGKTPKFAIKRETIDYIYLEITYAYKRKVTNGFKITGNDGAKGVVCKVVPDEDMPTTTDGIRADLIMSSDTAVNRTNIGQLEEQWINYCGVYVRRQAAEMPLEDAYIHIMKFINMINPQYALIVDEEVRNVNAMDEFVETCIESGIRLICPPFLQTISPNLMIELKETFNVPLNPVTFNLRDSAGNLLRRVTTRKPVVIGDKYIYLLCKIPHARSAGVSHVNQYKIPVRPHHRARDTSPVSIVPIRFGEDENRQILLATGPENTARFMSQYSNSYKAVEKMSETLLTMPDPTKLENLDMTTEEMIESNRVIGIVRHLFSTTGVDLKNVATQGVDYQEQDDTMKGDDA